jgi:two-component system NtrC family sensor kinase
MGKVAPRFGLVAWMLLAVAAIASLAFWDEQREADAALHDFAEEQAMLAQALSRALAERLAIVERDALEAARDHGAAGEDEAVASRSMPQLLSSIRALEHPGALRVLVRPPKETRWLAAADGSNVTAGFLDAASSSHVRSIRLSRAEAAELGLPPRMAMAGVAHVDAGPLGRWAVVVVTTAKVERDRESRARWRLLLGVTVAGGLVLAFGSAALRRQTKQLELSHALAISDLETKRDQRLVTADKLATMGALATGVAHEVATPLGVIVARAEQVVARAEADEPTRRAAEIIAAQAERIHIVIRGFLALARGQIPRLEESRPESLADAAVGLIEHRFVKAGVTLTSRLDPDLGLVACDARMFEQVLVNLLLNACEACSPGGAVELSVRDEGERIAFVVEDDGVGIDDETAARATEPFFTTKPEGTGLGLAITNEIVHHHGGSLVLRARASGGTTAVVELPAVRRGGSSA